MTQEWSDKDTELHWQTGILPRISVIISQELKRWGKVQRLEGS